MERIEENQSRPVHVLRHRFEPNEPLIPEINKLLVPEARTDRFRFYATRIAILDGANFYSSRYDIAVSKAAEKFMGRRAPTMLSGDVNFREVGGKLRIGFKPQTQAVFNKVLSDFDNLPTLRPDGYSKEHPEGAPVDHYIYTEVPVSAVAHPKGQLGLAVRAFRETVMTPATRMLYTFRPLEFSGYDHSIVYGSEEEEIAAKGRSVDPWDEHGVAS